MILRRIVWICLMLLFITGCNTQSTVDNINDEVSIDEDEVSIDEQNDPTVEESEESQTGNKEPQEELIYVKVPLLFRVDLIDEQMAEEMMGKSYHENEHIQLEDLRYVQTGYFGFDGEEHQGAVVVHQAIASDILDIFMELYDARYPIEQLAPIDLYGGDDDASMLANNSSAFNYRVVAGTDRLSRHAYGLAVDINPLINPWVTSNGIYPPEGSVYADRTMEQQGMIKAGDPCYSAFTSRGFEWGGEWNSSKDYQHFDIKIEGINK